MEETLQHLKNIGFTELEAKCLYVLAEGGTQTGYEIAKRLGVSRSNVYSALQKLAEKGVVLTSHGEPTHYQSLPIEEIGDKIHAELQASIRYVQAHMPKQDAQRSEYFSLDGDAKVASRIRTELKQAKEEALLDLWSEEAELLKEEISEAQARGVRVLVSTIGEVELAEGVTQFPHGRDEEWQERSGRKFTLLIDRKLAIIGTWGGSEPTKAMLTEHPPMVELLLNNFFHDVVIHELMADMGPKLEDKYGKNFKKIVQKYTDPGGGKRSPQKGRNARRSDGRGKEKRS
ncbi:TrmB family transcriptional regulator [Paenibacillus hexagrammi]|uniref:HTH domain-containing protein n=1 Tax=Paenibacillus hexagrammi TaxID=2908839 RepID=A0ABY3SLB1_9BACL|nr:helix-turn-helix domain-containing protein [Paenibacillus sp. YPD9-1]UJF34185.1 HTH domain-containing protein [Paenibacillus sp. YPD9-1]